jgi:K+-sensing histidine kinase KdpD
MNLFAVRRSQNLPGLWRTATDCLLASIALAVLTFVAFRLHITTAKAALLFFLFIVLISLWASFVTSLFGCITAVLSFNYFLAPPIFVAVITPIDRYIEAPEEVRVRSFTAWQADGGAWLP